MASFVFTKILKYFRSYLRNEGIRFVIYLDEFLILVDSFEQCKRFVELACNSSKRLGLTINLEKSVYAQKLVKRSLNIKTYKIRDFAEFIGYLVSCWPAEKYSHVRRKRLKREKYLTLELIDNNYDRSMKLFDLNSDLQCWFRNISCAYRSSKFAEFSKIYRDMRDLMFFERKRGVNCQEVISG